MYFDPESPGQIAGTLTSPMVDPQKHAECAARVFENAGCFTMKRCVSKIFPS